MGQSERQHATGGADGGLFVYVRLSGTLGLCNNFQSKQKVDAPWFCDQSMWQKSVIPM